MKRYMRPNSDQMSEELALLGHDIRSAVTDVLAGIGIIDATPLTQSDKQQLDRARATCESLVRFLEGGLTTLLEQAPAQMQHTPTDIARLLNDLMRRWSYASGAGGPAIALTTANLPAMAHCDRTSVERVLSNLLSNAIAHSGGKLVHFEVSHPAPNLLSFTITDQGQGIPPDIAERTNRGSSDKKALPAWKDRTGRGLGLTIAQTLSQRMGATLWLGSAPDGGCMAKMLLPISLAQPAAQPAAAVLDLHGQRVLIAEDSTPQLLLLAQYLCDTGANITMVRDGVAAETALLAGGFDLALLDLELPGRTGLEICTALRTKMAKPPRILVLTAHTDPAIHQSARAAGASQVLVKPITSASALALALADPKAKQPQAQDGAIGLAKLLEIAGPDLAEELLARFDEDLTSVQSQLAAALPRMDWHGLRKASHVLIALAGTAGMTQLEHSARAFNSAANESNSAAVSTEAPAVMDGLAKLLALVVRMAQDRQGAV